MAEHLGHVQVEGLHAVGLLEGEVGIARGLADDIHRGTFTLSDLADVVDVLLVDEQAHALLTLVGNDLFAGERLVTNGQLGHVDLTATLLYKLGEAVEVAG